MSKGQAGIQDKQTDDDLLDELVDEIGQRFRRHETVDVDDYVRRHPQHADRLRKMFPTLQAMADIGHSIGGKETAAAAEQSTPQALGDFQIVREIGRGGMGVVYEAQQLSLGRRIALKVLPFAAVLDQRQIQRFKNEALAAAQLDHPNIVDVYGVGCERSVHFYAMRYVEGEPLSAVIDQLRRLRQESNPAGAPKKSDQFAPTVGHDGEPDGESPAKPPADSQLLADTGPLAALSTECSAQSPAFFRSVAEIGVQVAEALDHAHQQGVMHRDIKPANIMLDLTGKAWITDFGLARIESAPGLTMTGDILGTLRYMSPEQALAKRVVVDHRTDVYSLGATLYELLTHRPAFDGQDRHELLRQVAFEEPHAPRKLNKAIPAELETVVMKAMAKNPAERYATAQDLADDLQRFLENKPIRARRISLPGRFTRWCKRNPMAATVAALLLFLAVAGPLVAVNQTYLAASEASAREKADEEARRARAATAREREARRQIRRHLYVADMNLAQHAWDEANLDYARQLLKRHLPTAGREDLRAFEWYHFWQKCHPNVLTLDDGTPVSGVAFSPDGKSLASASADHTVRLWDARTGNIERILKGHTEQVLTVTFSPDGKTLASGGYDCTVKVWQVSTGELVTSLDDHERAVKSVVFSPDGGLLASGSRVGSVKLWQVPGYGEKLTIPGRNWVDSVAFSPDGKLLAIPKFDGIEIRDTASGELRKRLEGWGCWRSVAFSPDGAMLAGGAGAIRLWDCKTGELKATLQEQGNRVDYVLTVAFSPDGKTLASGGYDRTVTLWSVPDGEPIATYKGHSKWVRSLAFSPDGSTLASASEDNTINLRNVADDFQEQLLRAHRGLIRSVAFSPEGRWVASSSSDGRIKLWDVTTRNLKRTLEHGEYVGAVAVSPDGKLLASASHHRGIVKLWSADSGELLATLKGHRDTPRPVRYSTFYRSVAFSPDGKTLASAGTDEFVALWDVSSQKEIGTLTGHTHLVQSVAFSPNGEILASGAADRTVRLWDLASRRLNFTLTGHLEHVWYVAFSPDGNTLASASRDHTVKLWDVETGKLLRTLSGHADQVCSAAFSPDGKTLATGSVDTTIKLWDVPLGEAKATLYGHRGYVYSVAFSSDGNTLASGDYDGTVRLWRAARDAEGQRRYEPAERPLAGPAARAALYCRQGEWRKAAADYSKVVELNPDDVLPRYQCALTRLAAGDLDGYRQACAELLEHFAETEDVNDADFVAWTCALAPDAVSDFTQPVRLAEQVVESGPQDPSHLGTLGAVLYRGGRFEEAINRLIEADRLLVEPDQTAKTSPAYTWFFLAMAHHRLEHAEEAGQWLDKAIAEHDKVGQDAPAWNRRLTLELLRREAESLLAPTDDQENDE